MSDNDDYDCSFTIASKPTAHEHVIQLSEEITSNNSDYYGLIHFLENKVSEEDIVKIYMACFGGSIHTGLQIASAIQSCRSPVIVEVTNSSYSMGAVLALCGDALIMRKGTFLMFHNYSGWFGGKGKETLDQHHEFEEHVSRTLFDICSPFLTKREVKQIRNDKDVYIHEWDEDLATRCSRHFKAMREDK